MSELLDRLRKALEREHDAPPLPGDDVEYGDAPLVPAAVLIAVTDAPEPGVILTIRRDDMRTHAGQVAFPGGRIDPGEDAVTAALREVHEELGLDPAVAEIAGILHPYRTITDYEVTPVVAVVAPGLPLAPHELEVAGWFEAPLAHLLNPANQHERTALFRGRMRHYYEIEWSGHRIWGATAAMIVNLAARLQWR